MKKKNLFAVTLCLILTAACCIPAFAAETRQEKTCFTMSKEDREGILSAEKAILSDANAILEAEDASASPVKKLSLDEFVKVYTNTDVFSLKDDSAGSLQQLLKASDAENHYIYEVILHSGKTSLEVCLEKGKPLTDSEKENLTDKETKDFQHKIGTWYCTSVTVHPDPVITETVKQAADSVNGDLIAIDSLPGMHGALAVSVEHGKATKLFPLSGTLVSYDAIKDAVDQKLITKTNTGYSYSKIKTLANADYRHVSSEQSGGGTDAASGRSAFPPGITAGILCAAGVIVVLVLWKMKKQKGAR